MNRFISPKTLVISRTGKLKPSGSLKNQVYLYAERNILSLGFKKIKIVSTG